MISIERALALRQAGLQWRPQQLDCFGIPGGDFDGKIFSINDQPALLELLHGQPAITFHGSSEWALDHLYLAEVVWLPTETQLRSAIVGLIDAHAPLMLERSATGYTCHAGPYHAQASAAEDAYAEVLLHLLAAHENN